MSAYRLESMLLAWKIGNLTTEQVIGQILPVLQDMEKRVTELEGRSGPPHPPEPSPRRRKTTGRE